MIKKGYSKSTLITIKFEMASFQMFLLQRNVNYIAELTGSDIQSFILTFSKYAKSTIPKKMYYLRLLLQYMYQIGETADDLSLVCPHVKRGNYANSLPSVFSENEIIRILASIDKESPVGKRDYALLLAVIRLGLRASDIIRLRFCNIDWHNKNISVYLNADNVCEGLDLLRRHNGDRIIYVILDNAAYQKSPAIFSKFEFY